MSASPANPWNCLTSSPTTAARLWIRQFHGWKPHICYLREYRPAILRRHHHISVGPTFTASPAAHSYFRECQADICINHAVSVIGAISCYRYCTAAGTGAQTNCLANGSCEPMLILLPVIPCTRLRSADPETCPQFLN